ncbi:MAG TPA: hypothetical protein VHT94_07350 [Streptosporangiaceae bacterium]|jgi:hypothetical protein|nr:hypothetical protein [Streptosporangiaceae bacterium]
MAERKTLSTRELAMVLSWSSMALEFCYQPETYPAFVRWLTAEHGLGDPPGRETLEAADVLVTGLAAKAVEKDQETPAGGHPGTAG